MKPRILFVIDRPGWSFDIDAQNLVKVLGSRYDFRFLYVDEGVAFEPKNYDLIHIFFWGERYQRRYQPAPSHVIKEISSHRWEVEAKYGYLSPPQMADTYLRDAATTVATSQKLYRSFEPHVQRLFHCPKGFDPGLFSYREARCGPLQVGWAGNAQDRTKGLVEVLRPACQGRVDLREAGGGIPYREMSDFYNQLDLILVGSLAEGTPQPLLEAMASGCFPISTDVGNAPEVIEHGVNGLIVDRSAEAFAAALDWCAANVDQVRQEGRENARRMLESRDWSRVSQQWSQVFDTVLDFSERGSEGASGSWKPELVPDSDADQPSGSPVGGPPAPALTPPQLVQLESLGPRGVDAALAGRMLQEGASPILVIGAGSTATEAACPGLPGIEPGREPVSYLQEHQGEFGGILLMNMDDTANPEVLLARARQSLMPGGRVYVLTPNLLNWRALIAGITQRRPRPQFSENSLSQKLRESGFCQLRIYGPKNPGGLGRLAALPFQVWSKLRGQLVPKTGGKYLLLSGKKPQSEL